MALQKVIFSNGEGDAWFERNRNSVSNIDFENDLVIKAFQEITDSNILAKKLKVLEIGCGNGSRLGYIKSKYQAEVYGLDPSKNAVLEALNLGVNAVQGTADELPFSTDFFDVLIFGFCLYLCDREDLFKINYEADRILNDDGFIIIIDFFSQHHTTRKYHHKDGLLSYKMDYTKLFTWHPYYNMISNHIIHHVSKKITDDANEYISVSLIRKKYPQE